MRTINLFIKRAADILISLAGVLVLVPIWFVIVVLMKVTMPGPVFFRQSRVGKNFKLFDVLKFRTMKVDKEAEQNFRIEKDKDRITPLGQFMRRTKIDETPQLLNVLKGDMSLVGPRPTVQQRVQEYPNGQEVRLSMRPGMTGISQVKGNVLLSWQRRIEYDCQYVKDFNILLDLSIIFKTVGVVLFGEEKYISKEDLEKHKNPIFDSMKK